MNTRNNERLVTFSLILGALALIRFSIFWPLGLVVFFTSLLGALYLNSVKSENTSYSGHLLTVGLISGAFASIGIMPFYYLVGLAVVIGSLLGALYFNYVFDPEANVNECKLILFLVFLNLTIPLVVLYYVISTIIMIANLPLGIDVMMVMPPWGSFVQGAISVTLLVISYINCREVNIQYRKTIIEPGVD